MMTKYRTFARPLALVAAVAGLALCGTARSAVMVVGAGSGAPAATLGPYTMKPFPADTVNPKGAETTSIPTPLGSPIKLSSSLEHDSIGDGWGTWSNGYTGDVYDEVIGLNSVVGSSAPATGDLTDTLTLPAGTGAFYLYFEPEEYGSFDMTVTASDGTSATQVVTGDAGADYFGFYATPGQTLDSLTVTSTDAHGYAIGEFGIAAKTAVPEPASLGVVAAAGGGLLAGRRRRGRAAAR